MWFIFILASVAAALAALAVVWIGNEVFLSMKRRNRKFEQERAGEKESTNHEG